MKEYFPFFRNYRKALLLAPAFVIVDVFREIVQPKVMSKVIEYGVSQIVCHISSKLMVSGESEGKKGKI